MQAGSRGGGGGGGGARGQGGRHSSTRDTMAVIAAAIVNVGHSCGRHHRQHRPLSQPLPPLRSTRAGPIASPSRTTRGRSKRTRGVTLVDKGHTVVDVDGNVGVEYVSFFNGHASDIFIYFHHPDSSSSSSTPPSTLCPSKVSVESSPVAAIPSNPSTASAASSSLSL